MVFDFKLETPKINQSSDDYDSRLNFLDKDFESIVFCGSKTDPNQKVRVDFAVFVHLATFKSKTSLCLVGHFRGK